jgi:hypothetical protein
LRTPWSLILVATAACSDGGAQPPDAAPPDAPSGHPSELSKTGLYSDFASRTIAPDLIPFTPRFRLWSDGAEKRRFLSLPAGATVDTSVPDHWRFPVGTKVWKEFVRDGILVETRLIERTGPGDQDYWFGSYVWKDDGSDAIFAEDGAQDIRGTDHDAPAAGKCGACHVGEPGRILGFSAVQLDAATLARVAPRLSAPFQEFTAPGSATTATALGYLHANCGHCHSETGAARPDTDMMLRLMLADRTPADTAACRTTWGVALFRFRSDAVSLRVAPGDPAASGIVYRMSARGSMTQMPPLATEHTDPDGIAAVRAWIAAPGACATN